jgi:hypothetical protein
MHAGCGKKRVYFRANGKMMNENLVAPLGTCKVLGVVVVLEVSVFFLPQNKPKNMPTKPQYHVLC